MTQNKLYPTTFTLSLGTIEMTQKRRAAYERAMAKDGYRSLGEWLRFVADKASHFEGENNYGSMGHRQL